MSSNVTGEFTLLEHRAVAVIYFVSGFFGIAENLVTLLIFSRENPLAGARNRLHVMLALANIMVVAGTPFCGTSAFNGRWMFGELGCKLYGLETYIGGNAALAFAILLCVERYLATACRDLYSSMCGTLTGLLTLFGWLFSVFWACAPLLGWNSFVIESAGTACGLDWADADSSFFKIFPLSYGFLLLIGVFCIRQAHASLDSTADKIQPPQWFTENQLNWIATGNLVIVVLGFGPYAFMAIWTVFNKSHQITMIGSVIAPIAAKLSTILGPLTYLLASESFRSAYAARTIGGSNDKKQK